MIWGLAVLIVLFGIACFFADDDDDDDAAPGDD